MQILIRCDASLLIGSGHVMRCRTLARELQRCGGTVSFLCRRQLGDLIGLLEKSFLFLLCLSKTLRRAMACRAVIFIAPGWAAVKNRMRPVYGGFG